MLPDGIKRFVFKDRETWLAARENYIGASEYPALVCGRPISPFRLACRKHGIEPEEDDTETARRGRLLEPVGIEVAREKRPDWLIIYNAFPNLHYFFDADARLACTPDAFVLDRDFLDFDHLEAAEHWDLLSSTGLEFVILQIKSVERTIFRRDVSEGGWQSDGEIVVPEWIQLQAALEAAITGATAAYVGALVVSWGIDLHILPVPLDPGLLDFARAQARAFWSAIAEGRAYEPDFARDSQLIRSVYGSVDEKRTVDLSGDNEIEVMRINDAELAATEKRVKSERRELRDRVLMKMRGAGRGMKNGVEIVRVKTIKKAEHVVAASEYPQITFAK